MLKYSIFFYPGLKEIVSKEGKVQFRNAEECWRVIQGELKRELLVHIERFARENSSPTRVVFGTSGWRGEIGTDFTFRNVGIVSEAILNILKRDDEPLRKALGFRDFDELKKRGVIIGHDNRFLGPEFAKTVMGVLAREGIRLYFAGETTTPEISASIEMLHAGCSINITPSHNPSNYSGLKFNPADGGPAGPEITEEIEKEANHLMETTEEVHFQESTPAYEQIDTTELYREFLLRQGVVSLERVEEFLEREDCLVVVDHVHGATRGRPERLIRTAADLTGKKLLLLRTEDDYLFGGVAPEPSEKNMQNVVRLLRESNAKFRLGVIMDPDGDRIRFADQRMQIPMNYFGAMALHFLHKYKGVNGVVVKSVGTSNFVNAIAAKEGIPVRETKVGFKNFRPYLLPDAREKAIVAFEESDGITAGNHTLEKDALFGLLLAIEMVATTGKNLSDYLTELMDRYGYYYPDRSGVEVDRSLAGETLRMKISSLADEYSVGSIINVGGRSLKIVDQITVDGVKFVLEDGSWFMIRPSGTEPKVRFYIEARDPEEKRALFSVAETLTKEAVKSG
ncbi:MAG TPA: phosphomannomutase [Nitrospirae bacterium]|nr:phosphomannomutase [Nitrospirota bacterium]